MIDTLRATGSLLAERLLGALELTVVDLDMAGVPPLWPFPADIPPHLMGKAHLGMIARARLGRPPARGYFYSFGLSPQESRAITAAALLERIRPGTADLTISLARRLAEHPLIIPLLAALPGNADEVSIAAAHGAGYLALAVAVARAVIGEWVPPARVGNSATTVVGMAIGTAVLMLRDTPMPPGYGAALLDKARAEYRLSQSFGGSVPVTGHRFALAEGEVPEVSDFSGNGLVAVVPGGAVIRTGVADGAVKVALTVCKQPPPLDTWSWDEVIEVSWHVVEGMASVTGLQAPGDQQLCQAGPPWPGDYRLRVYARGRDDSDGDDEASSEEYELVAWMAPVASEIMHKRTDRLGHRLRGESEPSPPMVLPRDVRGGTMALVRTDFSDQGAWDRLRVLVSNSRDDGAHAAVGFVDDIAYRDWTAEKITRALPPGYQHPLLAIADQRALASPDFPLTVVHVRDAQHPSIRVLATRLPDIENNLSLANMHFHEFADAVDHEGVFRGFLSRCLHELRWRA